jgi:two-component system response regulator ResD
LAKPVASAVILLIEGTRRTGEAVGPVLSKKGFEVLCASTTREALGYAKSQRPAAAVFDCAAWRGRCAKLCSDLHQSNLPVLVLLAEHQGEPENLPEGVATLRRPFTPRKLTNCVRQLVPEADGDVLQTGGLHFNVQHHHVRKGRVDYHLTPMQAQLLEVFMRHPGETLSRRFLIKQVWGWNIDDLNDTRTLDVHVRWLREIIEENASAPKILATVRGVGYRFGPPEKTP